MRAARPLLLLVLTLLAAACERGITTPSQIEGEWVVEHPQDDGSYAEHRMSFGGDGDFTARLRWYGPSPANELLGYYVALGSYRLEGTTLLVRLTRTENWHRDAVGENPGVEIIRDPAWGESGTVHVDGDRLTFTYVSAPADGPQVFTEEYRRVR